MDLKDLRRSDNVEDVRGGGGGRRGASIGIGGLVVVLAVSWLFNLNPAQLLQAVEQGEPVAPGAAGQVAPQNDGDVDFVRAILGDTEDVWTKNFPTAFHRAYAAPKLVLFSGGTESACGSARTQSGPFYCPANAKLYLDMEFFKYLKATAKPGDDFARAYAIAHEVGHHVQDLLGTLDDVAQKKRQDKSKWGDANGLQVRVELQADCFAGVWGHFTQQRALVGREDIEGALAAASQIGDDYLQKQAGRAVTPESFTHGSSAQRVTWFKRGLDSGDPLQCDTFAEH
jgi:predicted metalloprotease